MSMYIKNYVTIPSEIMETIKEKYFTNNILDFNKIIPMPKSLELDEGDITDKSIFYAFSKKGLVEQLEIKKVLESYINILDESYWNKIQEYNNLGYYKDIEQYAKKFIPNDKHRALGIKNLEDLGDRYIQNIKDYKYPTWFDWCYENWGTKWNVCNFSYKENKLFFETANQIPDPIFIKLSKEFPNASIKLEYDVTGDNDSGTKIYENGNCITCESKELNMEKDITEDLFE